MEQALPLIFLGVMGFALLVYVILDGYDLGIGILLPLAGDEEKDTMIASIGPYWDANETWLVLGVGVLLIGFPSAYAMVLTALYLPVTLMLFGLINTAFSLLIALTMPALYVVLGAGWLMIKCEGRAVQEMQAVGKECDAGDGAFAPRDFHLEAAHQCRHRGTLVCVAKHYWPRADSADDHSRVLFGVLGVVQLQDCPRGVRLAGDGGNDPDVRDGGAGTRVQFVSVRGAEPIDHLGIGSGNEFPDVCVFGVQRQGHGVELWREGVTTPSVHSLETRSDQPGPLRLLSRIAVFRTGELLGF